MTKGHKMQANGPTADLGGAKYVDIPTILVEDVNMISYVEMPTSCVFQTIHD